MGLKILTEVEVAKEAKVAEGSICDDMPEDKREQCKLVLDEHANMNINNKEAEKRISELAGEEIHMTTEPDWKMLPQDKDTLETWATSVCMAYDQSSGEKTDDCVNLLDKVVKQETSLEEACTKIGRIMREDPDEIAKTVMLTVPTVQKS